MRKGFIAIIIFVFALSMAGCGGKSGNANSNVSENNGPQETPLPEFTDANEALAVGTRLFDDGKTEMAIEAFNQAVKLNPDLAEAYFKMGIAHALIESAQKNTAAPMETEDANTATNTNTKEEPKSNSQKAFLKAVAAYKKMVQENPKDDVAYYNMGRAYNKLNKDDEAEDALRQAVKLKPDDTEYQTELGSILIKLAKYGEAVGSLKKASELDPDNITAQELLEEADAGLRRVDYVNPRKDERKSNSNSNAVPSASPGSVPGETPFPPPPMPANRDIKPVKQPTPVKTAPPAKPKPH